MAAAAVPNGSNSNGSEIVSLNIGGVIYTTVRSTLLKGGPNFFTALLDPNSPHTITRDKNGHLFIDRPGIYFGPLLEFLMTGDFILPQTLVGYEKQVAREAQFYLIPIPSQLFSLTQTLDWVSGTLAA